jgi:plastocyanin
MSLLGRSIGLPPALAALASVALCAFAFAGAVSAADPTAVSIVDRLFQPAAATIQVGDTVTWTVTRAIADPHSVTSGSPSDSGKAFDSGIKLRKNGDTFSWTFTTAGSFPYYCVIHPAEMHGAIVVLPAGQSGAPGATGAPAESTSPAASAIPGSSAAPGSGGSPSPSAAPEAQRAPISGMDKLIAAGIVGASLVILFGAASFYRRVNG